MWSRKNIPFPLLLLLWTLFAVLLLFLLSPFAMAQLLPAADTFVSSSSPNLNYGTSPILLLQPGATIYVKFDLSSVPVGANVTRATLRLYVDALVKQGSFDVRPVLGSWSENTLTYNSPLPALGAPVIQRPISVSSFSLSNYVLADVTSLVQAWVSGSLANNGLALVLASEGGTFSFDSREGLLTGNSPELDIQVNQRADSDRVANVKKVS